MRFRTPGGYVITPGPPPLLWQSGPPDSAVQTALAEAAMGRDALADKTARHRIETELARWRVRTIVLVPIANQDRVRVMLTTLLGTEPEYTGGVYVWRDVRS